MTGRAGELEHPELFVFSSVDSAMAERPDASSLEAELAQLRERVEALEREKADLETFSAVAAHELLTPVVMIDACAAMVADRLDEALHPESHEDLDNMRRGA